MKREQEEHGVVFPLRPYKKPRVPTSPTPQKRKCEDEEVGVPESEERPPQISKSQHDDHRDHDSHVEDQVAEDWEIVGDDNSSAVPPLSLYSAADRKNLDS